MSGKTDTWFMIMERMDDIMVMTMKTGIVS